MNKQELIDKVHASLPGNDVTKKQAKEAVETVLSEIQNGVVSDKNVQVIGFGTFKVGHRKARTGRNPHTGDPIEIAASNTIKFSPSSSFKESVQ